MARVAAGPVQLCPLWSAAAKRAAASASPAESHVFVVGPRGCGKTTLLRRILQPGAATAEPPPPSGAVEYLYARRGGGGAADAGSLAHFWELGGSEPAALALAQSQHVFLTAKQVPSAAVIICADLSDPASALATSERWLAAVRARLAAAYKAYEQRGLQVPEQLRQRARARLGPNHEDAAAVDVTGISLVLVATKWDALCERDAGEQRAVAAALRCLAHANGAHLAYVGGLQPGGGAGEAAAHGAKGAAVSSGAKQQAAALDAVGRLLLSVAFGAHDRRMPPPQLAPLAAVFAPAGSDRLSGIGWPDGRACGAPSAAGAAAQLEAWRKEVAVLFPQAAAAATSAAAARRPPLEDPTHAEEEVDAARAAVEAALGWGGAAAAVAAAAAVPGAAAVAGEGAAGGTAAAAAAGRKSRSSPAAAPSPTGGGGGGGSQRQAAPQVPPDPSSASQQPAVRPPAPSSAARGALSRLKRPPPAAAAPN